MPAYVVEADSVNSFKNRLDKYWANQEFVFNFNSVRTNGNWRSTSLYAIVQNGTHVWYVDAGIEDTP